MAATKRYRVVVDYLRYPADAASLTARVKGENDKVRWKVAKKGTIQTDIPEVSIPVLLEQGKIVAVGPSAKEDVEEEEEV